MHDDPFSRAVERVEAVEQEKRDAKQARRKARYSEHARRGFHIHLTVFLAVNALLIAIWAVTWQLSDGPSYPWFLWVLLGWGVGLAAHWSASSKHLRNRESAPDRGRQADTSKELERLAELHRAGSLDDEEFKSAKAKLLT